MIYIYEIIKYLTLSAWGIEICSIEGDDSKLKIFGFKLDCSCDPTGVVDVCKVNESPLCFGLRKNASEGNEQFDNKCQ